MTALPSLEAPQCRGVVAWLTSEWLYTSFTAQFLHLDSRLLLPLTQILHRPGVSQFLQTPSHAAVPRMRTGSWEVAVSGAAVTAEVAPGVAPGAVAGSQLQQRWIYKQVQVDLVLGTRT